ncbi:MAG: nitrilase-related carbon-nitrogen hydrolase, partial [Blautia hydrogenotrophica]
MRQGFVKVAAATPDVRVADCRHNGNEIIRLIREMEKEGAKVMVFPELCITGYTCADLFWQELLVRSAREELVRIVQETSDVDALIFVGLPFEHSGKLYNVAAAVSHGEVLGMVPKIHLPNYGEFYE